jgi:hypothetical protein
MQWLLDRLYSFQLWLQPLQGRIPEPVERWDRESFIPLQTYDLVDGLCNKLSTMGHDPKPFRDFCKRVIDRIHYRNRDRFSVMRQEYSMVDPDRDEALIGNSTGSDTTKRVSHLFDETQSLLGHANYQRLTPQQIQDAIQTASHWGLKLNVRLSMFRQLHVYARGDIVSKRTRRHWYRWFRLEEIDVPVYQRLVVLFRPKDLASLSESLDPDRLHMRMFKNVPKADVDMLLPGSGVRISWIDKSRIGIPTAWGFVMLASRLAKNIWLIAVLGALKLVTSVVLASAIAIASVFYIIKSFFSYHTAKRRYLLSVTQNLYYQMLDNNLGVLLRLIEESQEQEACEAILGYFCILHADHVERASHAALDRLCESTLVELGADNVDFDFDDALRDLVGMGIVLMDGDTLIPVATDLALPHPFP